MNVTDGRGRAASAPGLAAWVRRVAPPNTPPELTIALISDARIRTLNRQFRRKDAVTDVLSFEPADIAIATGVARRQAVEAGHSYATELKVLALHGLLHLIGYDHRHPTDRERMGRLERRLRARGGLDAGLIERVDRAGVMSQRPERRRERAQRSEPRERPASARSASARSRRSLGDRGSDPAKPRARVRVRESGGRSLPGKK